MTDTESRAADDAVPDEETADGSRTSSTNGKHRAPVDPAAATPSAPTSDGVRGPADDQRGAAVEAPGESDGEDVPAEDQPEPNWWHRSHPTFAGLVGFFSGVLYVIAVPGIYGALLSWLLPPSKAQALFPLILVALIVPLGMLVPRKTRRFAQFMLLGVVCTAVVVGLTAALVIYVMVQLDK